MSKKKKKCEFRLNLLRRRDLNNVKATTKDLEGGLCTAEGEQQGLRGLNPIRKETPWRAECHSRALHV